MLLNQWFKTSNYPLPVDVWEDYIFDQFAYFSMAFDFSRASHGRYDYKLDKSYPAYLNYPCNNPVRSD